MTIDLSYDMERTLRNASNESRAAAFSSGATLSSKSYIITSDGVSSDFLNIFSEDEGTGKSSECSYFEYEFVVSLP